jgi:ubiquinone/menaquinone biosynthesis C-methylase UbiE
MSFGRAFEDWLRTYLARGAYRRTFDRLQMEGDERVLELGCGGGQTALVLMSKLTTGSYTGLDVDEWWAERARRKLRRHPNAEVLAGDVRDLPLEDGSFDLAVVHMVIHDIPAPDRRPIVSALAAKLRPGGRLFVKEPTGDDHGMPEEELWGLTKQAGLTPLRRDDDHSRWIGHLVEGEFVK